MRPLLLSLLVLIACSKPAEESSPSEKIAEQSSPGEKIAAGDGAPPAVEKPATRQNGEPDFIVVDHILISFDRGGIPGVTRSLAEAKTLAYDLLEQVKNGGDWAALKKKYTDDPGPSPYSMTNFGALRRANAYQRSGMVAAFGNVGFKLAVGEIGIADHSPRSSPYGYHIIKRVK